MVDFIEAHRDAHGVEPICRVLPIAPSTYYDHLAKGADPARFLMQEALVESFNIPASRKFHQHVSRVRCRRSSNVVVRILHAERSFGWDDNIARCQIHRTVLRHGETINHERRAAVDAEAQADQPDGNMPCEGQAPLQGCRNPSHD